METESSESAVQGAAELAKPKPKKKKKAKPAKVVKSKRPQKKVKPATKRHARKNGAARKPRACRMDIRLTAAEREKLTRKAAATRRTVTSIVAELIEKMK
jgi:hypothetical protein